MRQDTNKDGLVTFEEMCAYFTVLGAELDDALEDAHDGVTFHCVGACATPRAVKSKGGNALMGGHMYPGVTVESDLAAYRWFLERANGGDGVLVGDNAAIL